MSPKRQAHSFEHRFQLRFQLGSPGFFLKYLADTCPTVGVGKSGLLSAGSFHLAPGAITGREGEKLVDRLLLGFQFWRHHQKGASGFCVFGDIKDCWVGEGQ